MPRLAVFDLDGTLIDTAPDLVDTTNVVLEARGLAAVPAEIIVDHIGVGARVMVASAMAEHGITVDDATMDKIHAEYLAHYATRLARLSRAFPEILAALPKLKADGVTLAVCTNKREDMARQLLGELGLMDEFVVLTGGDTFAFSKPDARHLLETIALAGGDPANTVFVGDSRIDFETAQNAKIPMVGLSYGYSDVPMAELGPDALCKPGEDIAAAILGLFPAA
ncbi:HAD-IA family hydrolase [Acuticoccus sp. MNP-M23]|uniref:HAD-IA family hydrolase n=1 Tax=Acuticoccus sp. MNP-M23 TaxID=3072793 RepID=UPI0028151C72|nr:HAD-IA family hydrolase [Acuticoccus sp. MNP-M23]WMS41219.1 HAD-IA family hydrolase [Acuticoccus sp. MNP-M23]